MLIFIIGYMGAGKTTLGKRLAESLNYRFYDLDEMIGISTGYSILSYFEKFGEASFRRKESEILLDHIGDDNAVIATGGGTPCYSDNMALMNQKGTTVFIDTPYDTIIKRLAGRINQYPLLKSVHPDLLPSFIRSHMNNRMAFYLQAKIRIDGGDEDADRLVDAVRLQLSLQ